MQIPLVIMIISVLGLGLGYINYQQRLYLKSTGLEVQPTNLSQASNPSLQFAQFIVVLKAEIPPGLPDSERVERVRFIQDQFLNQVDLDRGQIVSRMRFIPGITLRVTNQQLENIKINPLVESIQEDKVNYLMQELPQ